MTEERPADGSQEQEPPQPTAPQPGMPRSNIRRGTGGGAGVPEGARGGTSALFDRMRQVIDAARQATEEQLDMAQEAAADLRERAGRAAKSARPEIERMAAEAKAVAETARPKIDY